VGIYQQKEDSEMRRLRFFLFMIWVSKLGWASIVGVLIFLHLATLGEITEAQAIETWIPTGSLNVARANDPNPLVLLADGRVLAVAGFGTAFVNLKSVEIYDPSTCSWSFTGSLGTVRRLHSATRLLDGKVLAAGGGTASAELFDPVTETWTATGSLSVNRERHTATLLANGKVLFAGGQDGVDRFNSAELHDPSSGMFTPTGSMGIQRQEFTATLLPNGKVLVVGGQFGFSAGDTTTSAELYDPITGTFSPTGSLGTKRSLHTATLLMDGKVLIVGGTPFGCCVSGTTASAELYDPVTETFSPTGDLMTARLQHRAVLMPDGRVLIMGGVGPGDVLLSSVEVYDPSTGTFSSAASMGVARKDHGAVLLQNGDVLVAGGSDFALGTTNSAELFTSVTPVTIDIKPGSDPNSINCNDDNKVITVAILTTQDFDATTVDHTTVTFEGASEIHVDGKTGEPRRHEGDVDGDGDIDLEFHFRLGDTNFTCNSTEGTLMGEAIDGQPIKGTDSVRMINQ